MRTRTILTMFSATLAFSACGGDDGDRDDAAGDSTGGDTGTADASGTATATTTAGTTATTTATTVTTTSSPETTDPDTGDDTTAGGGEFQFDDAPPDEYTRVDRMGMPAVATALISMKDAYNEADPTDDVEGLFVSEIVTNLDGLHMALDDDITGAGLTPCAIDDCVAQGAPLVVPDTLKIDLTGTAGFPNGRRPADPVVDLTLAVIFLDLGLHDVTTFAELPLNPPENDKELPAEFPYVATPHE